MYAVVGLCLAEELWNKSYDLTDFIGGLIIFGTYAKEEIAKEEAFKLNVQSTKTLISFNYFVTRLGAIHMITLESQKATKSEEEEASSKDQEKKESTEKKESSVIETLAESFSTYLHSMGTKIHSTNLLRQAEESIPKRSQEVIEILSKDPSKLQELKEYYIKFLPAGPQLDARLRILEDVDETGLPNCLNNPV